MNEQNKDINYRGVNDVYDKLKEIVIPASNEIKERLFDKKINIV